MIKQKYIGIENELKSFKDSKLKEFDSEDFNKLLKGKYYRPDEDTNFRSDTGNDYYIDCNEIEIVTPPIALNKGFASRVTDSLIIGRNHVIRNTPDLEHTGYSMHWNLTSDSSHRDFYKDIAIPFQLFGLTPLSCGFNVKNKHPRYELLGDSLTNIEQINATALLLGAYSMAKSRNNFPLEIDQVMQTTGKIGTRLDQMLTNGRYTILNVAKKGKNPKPYDDIKFTETQAQNVLELFYEWLSPFVYKLGDRDEIRNLEAFVTRVKNLEMDDVKYFKMLKQEYKEFFKEYQPLNITTSTGVRSPVIQICDNPKVPLEGLLLKELITNENLSVSKIYWDHLTLYDKNNNKYYINGIDNIYHFMEQYADLKYHGTRNIASLKPTNIITAKLNAKLNKRSEYDSNKDDSAIFVKEPFIKEYSYKIKCMFKKTIQNISDVIGSYL